MIATRRAAAFCIAVIVVAAAACAPLNRAETRARIARDSVFMPLDLATPDSFLVVFETTRGRFDVMAHSQWAPIGTDRFYELVYRHFYDSVFVTRVVKGFVAQFGINGDPAVGAAWRNRRIGDDPPRESNKRGRISFARRGPGTRTTQLFINFVDNARLDTLGGIGYPPFGEVVRGMEVVDSLYDEYGGALQAPAVSDTIDRLGNAYIRRAFPKLDMIKSARVVQEWRRPPG